MSCASMSGKPSKAGSPWKNRRNQKPIRSSRLQFEAGFGAGICAPRAAARLAAGADQGQPHIFTMAGRRERIVIPIHGNQPLKTGLLRSLMKIAGLSETDS